LWAVAGWAKAVYNNVQLGFYARLGTLLLVIYALVDALRLDRRQRIPSFGGHLSFCHPSG